MLGLFVLLSVRFLKVLTRAEAKTKEEAKQLIEAGYSYVTDADSVKLFRKPK